MKKLIAALIASTLFLGASAFASVKVGLIDLPAILQHSPQVKAINQKLQDQFKPEQDKIIAAQKNLREEATKLDPQATAKLNDADKKALEAKVTTDQQALQNMVADFQKNVGNAQRTAMNTFMVQIDTAVKTVAEKNKLDMALLKPAVVYANDATDVTQQVLDALPK